MPTSRATRIALFLYGVFIIGFLYLPLVSVGFASISRARYLSFPIKKYSTRWYTDALASSTVNDLLWTSLSIAAIVTVISVVVAFFGALAFARYQWRYRSLFQKLILLPIFFPQTVLGLALLMWFNSVGIIPSWKTAVVAHLVWIAPIATLIVAIRAYSFDPALEEAARDMGADTGSILRLITLPLLMPGLVSAGLFAFLLSWGNFPCRYSLQELIQPYLNGYTQKWCPVIHPWYQHLEFCRLWVHSQSLCLHCQSAGYCALIKLVKWSTTST